MRILVTGAAGFIGSHLTESLVAAGHQVVGVDNFNDHLYPSSVKRKNAAIVAKSVEIHEVDIADPAGIERHMQGIDVVCHLAALAGVRPSLEQPMAYIQTNLHGLNVVLEAMRQQKTDRLVFASSSSVYGSRPGLESAKPFREDDPCHEQSSLYAMTKRAGELMASTYRNLHGIGVSCLRFFTVYGPRQRQDMAIHKFAAAIVNNNPIRLFGDGTSRRDYTYIDDIVRATKTACERVEPNGFNIYNLGGTKTTSLASLVEKLEVVLEQKAIVEKHPIQPGDVPLTFADITNLSRDLDYAPTVELEAGLEKFCRWYRSEFLA